MIEDSKRAQPQFNGLVDGVRKIVASEGWRGVYRGVGPVVGIAFRSEAAASELTPTDAPPRRQLGRPLLVLLDAQAARAG